MISYTSLKGSICSSADTPEFQLIRGVTMYMYIQGYVFICILFTYMYLHMYINLYMSILLTDYLCSDAVLDLSKRNLTEVDIKILEKRLHGYAPIQN